VEARVGPLEPGGEPVGRGRRLAGRPSAPRGTAQCSPALLL
jgi:hypothetical protein